MWKIPGREMGDHPSKHHGTNLHTSETDFEITGGCLTLDGTQGHISKTAMETYIQGKHAGLNPPIPCYSAVDMESGLAAGKEGTWKGKQALMYFEMLIDQFNVIFNLHHRVPDSTKVRANPLPT